MNFIIFNHDGSIKNVNFAEIIVQGNNLVNEIFVAVEGRSTDSYLATAYFELPNGDSNFLTATLASQSIDQSPYNGYKFLLTGAQTALYGRVNMSIKLEGVQGETLWTYNQALTINKSGYNPDFTMISMSQYAALIQAMGSLQEKYVVNNARFYSSLANAQADLDNLAFNQCVIIADVTATDPIPEIYFKNSESQLELLAGIGEYTFQVGTTTTETLSPGSDATVSVSFVASGKTITMNFTFGIPRGDTGATGNGISSVAKISTDGVIDTYRITFTNGSHFDYTITNGTLAGKLEVATFIYDSSSAVNFTQQLAKFIIDLVGNDLDKVKSITRLYTVPSAYQEYRGETVLFDIFRYTDYNSKFYLPDGTQITTSTDDYQFSILYEVDGITVADIGYFELSSSDTSGDLDDDQAEEARKTVCLIKRGNDIFHFSQEYEGTKYFHTIPLMRVTGYKQGSIEINGLDSNSPTWEYASEDYDMDSAPTQNSTNLVTSGGVHSAIATASAALDAKISKNAEDIAALTEALIKKDLYETEEATFQGITAVPAGALVKAYLDGFKGNSAVVNQLVQLKNETVSPAGYPISSSTTTHKITFSGTATSTDANTIGVLDHNITFQSGHTYLISFKISGTIPSVRLGNFSNITGNATTTSTDIFVTAPSDATDVRLIASSVNGTAYSGDLILQCVDCTIVPLTSAEMADVATAKTALKPKGMDVDSYIPYNAGTLTDSKPTKLISHGYNLFDGEIESGYWTNGTTPAGSSNWARAKNQIEVFSGMTYYFETGDGISFLQWGLFFATFDSNGNFLGNKQLSGVGQVSFSADVRYVKPYISFGTDVSNQLSNMKWCFHLASASLGYKPYVPPIEYDLTMPTLKSAGSVQDYVNNTDDGAKGKHLTSKYTFTGQESWGYDSYNYAAYMTKADCVQCAYGYVEAPPNILCEKYVTKNTYFLRQSDDKIISTNNPTSLTRFFIKDTSIISDDSQLSAFKTAITGVNVNYETNAPTDCVATIPVIFDVYAGGSIEVVGDGCDATTKVYFYVEA